MLTLTPAQRRIAARVKENVYKAVVRRAMIYALTERQEAKLKMRKVSRMGRIRNEYIRGEAHLRWFGYVHRRDSGYT